MKMAGHHLERLNNRRRETCPASDLVIGVQCGGSDAFSGLTANPAVGFATDLLVRAGATVMFSEVTEVRDGIDQLTARAATPEVAAAMVREMAWYDAYLGKGGADRSANTTPGNKKGGLANIVEKAMGSIVKSGSAPIVGVLGPGERLRDKGLTSGLVYAATPASDFICGTLQLAAGMPQAASAHDTFWDFVSLMPESTHMRLTGRLKNSSSRPRAALIPRLVLRASVVAPVSRPAGCRFYSRGLSMPVADAVVLTREGIS